MENKTNLYLLTGFLGAGKTTFLTNVLNDLSKEKVSVIMNEFGKIGIDGTIIQREGMELVELNRGSIFCSCMQLSFVSALIEMADRGMKYVIVESSGLADPSNIGEFLEAVKISKGDVYDYKGAICIIDGVNFLDQIEDIETVERQLKFSHLVVISKVDLIDENTLQKIKEKIREINKAADIVESIDGKINYKFLEKDLLKSQWVEIENTTNTPENKPKTLTLNFKETLEKKKLTEFLDIIKKDSYRIKGFFKLEDGWNQVDVVNKRIDYKLTDKNFEQSELVIISKIGAQIIRPIFDAWQKTVGKEMKLR
ncbi:CobW family GTP-binding protein [Tissierella creatinophila]|uniref:Putative GTP-binding protein YjiA n=1 Tax=Tissierella creatinophila DSM 6911 TaxID=1123403 RepID=A0A1U7M5B1_TISCR|nr:CobW family GTP-binding protein [Tissierella creatinophila]OLS02497.1 putative GTP-binding protein YjiA [Tissierella creatinophila DSM 6911]